MYPNTHYLSDFLHRLAARVKDLSSHYSFMVVLFACAAFAGLFFSCDKHEPVVDCSLKVGNIYCRDGRILPPSLFDTNRDIPIGVVVFLGDTSPLTGENTEHRFKAVAVGLDEWNTCIASANVELDGVGGGVEDMQGRANTAAMVIAAQNDTLLACPAAEYASRFDLGDGSWYIPACGELRHLSAVRKVVSPVLELVGGKPLTNQWYVSSSQDDTSEGTRELYMLNVSMAEGRVMSSEKIARKSVRPFILIQ